MKRKLENGQHTEITVMETNDYRNWMNSRHFVVYGFIFALSIVAMLVSTWISFGTLYIVSPDGDFYLSVADNFLATGHFMQTARPHEVNMVAQPGLPMILTALKMICNDYAFVVFIQYVLFGATNVFLADALYLFFNNILIGIAATAIYTFAACKHCEVFSPSYILTETWVLFILGCLIWMAGKTFSANDDKAKEHFANFALLIFAGMLIRPVFMMLYAVLALYALWCLKRKLFTWNFLLKLMIIPMAILALNVAVNYRETRHFVIMNNYSGIPLYEANNPKSQTLPYHSGLAEEFFEEDMWEVYISKSLDTHEKNKILSARMKDYVRHHILKTIVRSLEKFWKMFEKPWSLSFELMLISSLITALRYKRWMWPIAGVLAMLILSLPTSCGLNIFRYSIIALPFYAVYKAILLLHILQCLKWLWRKVIV